MSRLPQDPSAQVAVDLRATDLRVTQFRDAASSLRRSERGGHRLNPFRWLLAGVLCWTFSASAQDIGSAPVKNFVLPIFTKEGPRAVTLRGSSANRPNESQIDIIDMNLTRFTGDATQRIDDILLAPSASFFPDQHLAKGDKAVRLIRDEMEISGEVWTYDHVQKKVTLDKNVRVVFHAQMKDMLK